MVIFFASANSNPYKPLPEGWLKPCFTDEAGSPSCAELLGRVLHVGESAVLAALTARALVWQGEIRSTLLLAALGLSALYALSDETHQLFVLGRCFQLLDLALDFLGGVFGLMLYARICKYL